MKKAGTSKTALDWCRAEARRLAAGRPTVTRRCRRVMVQCNDITRVINGVNRFEFMGDDMAGAQAKAAELRAAGLACRIDVQYEVSTLPVKCRVPRTRYEWETVG